MNIVFATQNAHKAQEIQALLPETFQIQTLTEIGCTEDIPETADTLEGNAALKSAFVVERFNVNCFADDTGLEISALGNEPGVFSARYAGDAKNSNDNMDLVLKKMEGITNREAQFRTVISLRINKQEYFFEGIAEGEIRTSKSGTKGFGYDPIFQPVGFDVTFSEMSLDEKNKISHRGIAVRKLIEFLNNL